MSRLVGALSGGMNGMNGSISMNTGNLMVHLCETPLCVVCVWRHWLGALQWHLLRSVPLAVSIFTISEFSRPFLLNNEHCLKLL